MAEQTPKTVTVEALQWHTYNGQAYEVGDTYEIDEQLVDSVTHQGKAVRVDRVAVATAQSRAAAKSAPPAGRGRSRSTAVSPMTTKAVPVKPARAPRVAKAARASKAKK